MRANLATYIPQTPEIQGDLEARGRLGDAPTYPSAASNSDDFDGCFDRLDGDADRPTREKHILEAIWRCRALSWPA